MMLPVSGLINNLVSEVLIGRIQAHGYDQILRTVNNIEAASFPRGHTMGAVLFYGLVFFLARDFRSQRLCLHVQTAASSMIAIIGFARIWHGAHWPSEVLGAYAFGGLILVGIIALYQSIEAHAASFTILKPTVPATETENQHRWTQAQPRT